MGRFSRAKGKRGEREVAALARAAGLAADRTWQTAQSTEPSERACDVRIAGLAAQVKLRASGFAPVYEALEGADVAFVRHNRDRWIAVLPADALLKLLAGAGESAQSAWPFAARVVSAVRRLT